MTQKWYSSLQEQRQWQHNGREAAMLHGGKPGQESKSSKVGPNSELPKASNSARSGRIVPSVSKEQRQSHGAPKRKAGPYEDPRSARRQRGGATPHRERAFDLKDEAWLRKTMHVPTTTDYPDLPRNFFKEPKVSLFNAVQGLATLKATFVTVAVEVIRCTLRYESVARTEVVEAEGRSKVGLF